MSDSIEATTQIQTQFNELEKVIKLTEDTIGLIAGSDIPGKYCQVVLGVLQYHEEFLKRVKTQRDALKAQLPKAPEVPSEAKPGSPVLVVEPVANPA